MNKTKIEWCDYTWNPVTGCLHGCEYCYARRIAERFGRLDDTSIMMKYSKDAELKEPLYYQDNNDIMRISPYPYKFFPTFHRYRLDEPARKTKPSKIFVVSMGDLFGDWVPDKWIEEVFAACKKAPQHTYLFLTKNPSRYWQLHDKGILPDKNNYWYGTTLTHGKDEHRVANNLPAYTGLPKPTFRNTFVSAEPILDNIEGIHPMGGFFTYYPHTIKWAILGAETGNRKDKVIPERKWIENIVLACRKANVPVFMKDSLKDLMGDDFMQEWPEVGNEI
jgi:protein gp37